MFDVLGKAHVQHTVCLIEDQRFNRVAVEILFFDVLQQATGGGDHDILVFAKDFHMVHVSHAAGNCGDIQMRILRQFTGVVGNLHRQFARWRQN